MNRKRILVVDDEPDILGLLGYNLRKEGYEVFLANSGEEGFKIIEAKKPDLLILDLMLPGIDGLELCKILRADSKTSRLPILMLTAKGSETDEVVGLEVGADDYIAKPFNLKVLLARVKKLVQRQATAVSPQGVLKAGVLSLEPEKQKVTIRQKPVNLTALEFRILLFLMQHPGRVYSRNELLDHAWKGEAFVIDRTVDVHIKSIREKLGEAGSLVETVRGSGYRFKEVA